MLRNRTGVTLMEIMTVIMLGALMMVVAMPSLKNSQRAASMESARAKVESYLAVARAVAVRNGGRTRLVRTADTLTIQADTGTGWVKIGQSVVFDKASNVTLSGLDTPIEYDARGLAKGLDPAGLKVYITLASGYGAGTKDSICVTRFGALLDKKCGLTVATEKTEEPPIFDDGGPIPLPGPIDK